MTANWIVTPVESAVELPDSVDFISTRYDGLGYSVRIIEFFKEDGIVYEITFDHILAQRSMDEGKYLRTTVTSAPLVDSTGPLVFVEKGDFLDYFVAQSAGVFTRDEVKHVAILTMNEWIEVICRTPPKVRELGRYSLVNQSK